MEIQEFDAKTYQKNQSVMIYGATVGGKMIFQCLQSEGIPVECFVDRRLQGEMCCGVPVKSPEILKNQASILLIAVTRSYNSVCQFLDKIQFDMAYSCDDLISAKCREDFECERDEQVAVTDFLAKYPLYVQGFKEKKLVLPTLEIFITEHCTLRCRDCSHLVKYYENPQNYDKNKVLQYLDNFLKVVDRLEEVIILGGEPLLHPDLSSLLEYCKKEEKIGDITVISNGTIVPDNRVIGAMKSSQARLRLSDYGKLSPKIKEIRTLCEENDVECFVLHEVWTDMGKIFWHDYDTQELKNIFQDCPFAFDLLLLNGKICRCAHVAHLNNLQKIDSSTHDCVDFTNVSKENIEMKKAELLRYMNIEYLEGCQYCNGIKNSVQGIEAAIQEPRNVKCSN